MKLINFCCILSSLKRIEDVENTSANSIDLQIQYSSGSTTKCDRSWNTQVNGILAGSHLSQQLTLSDMTIHKMTISFFVKDIWNYWLAKAQIDP